MPPAASSPAPAEAEREAVVELHAMADDLYRVAKTSIRRHLDTHQPPASPHPRPTRPSFQPPQGMTVPSQ